MHLTASLSGDGAAGTDTAGHPNHNSVVGLILPVESVPLLLTARQAASMCGKSLRAWRMWDAAGRIPQPVRIGRSTLWRLDELRAWAAAGCPRRKEWELMQS